MRGVNVDGTYVEQVYPAIKEAVDRARAGEGPTLVEAMCYRMHGHFFGSDFSYMPKAHIEEMIREDCLPKLRTYMLEHQFSEAELDKIASDIDAALDVAVQAALDAPFPDASDLRKDVFEEEIAA